MSTPTTSRHRADRPVRRGHIDHSREVAIEDVPTAHHDMRSELEIPAVEEPAVPGLPDVVDDRYRVGALLGRGGMADVVRARDVLLDRDVALKILREDAEANRARFMREARLLARLSHPKIVKLIDAGVDDAAPYLVMDLVEGTSLTQKLDAPLDLTRAASYGAQVAEALAYAHDHDVIHRDVKPGNVLVLDDGSVRLADFGIARMAGECTSHTSTGAVVGSAHYLAPEQVAGEEVTSAVDVYALGMLLLRAVTGRHAFDGSNVEAAIARLSVDPPIPTTLPARWQALLTSMTARHPADRPTAAEAAQRLHELSLDVETTRVAIKPVTDTRRITTVVPHLGDVSPRERWQGWMGRPVLVGPSVPLVVGMVLVLVLLLAGLVPTDRGSSSGAPGSDAPTAPSSSSIALTP